VTQQDRARRARLVAAFRDGLGLAAVAVIGGSDGVRIAATGQADGSQLAATETVQARWWCRRASDAEDVAAAAAARLRRHAPDVSADAARRAGEAITRAAKRRNVDLLPDQDIIDQAATVIARIDDELEQLRQSGALRSVNKSYHTYRLEAAARGERVMPYAQWMLGYKEALVRKLAETLRYL
jgi:type III secretion system FlhB-like substrate exporter